MLEGTPFEWPPKRFREGCEWCERFGLRRKFDDPVFLQKLRDRIMRIKTGDVSGPISRNTFLDGLGGLLHTFTETDRDYQALAGERGEDEASVDVQTCIYLLMLNNQTIVDDLVR